MAMLRFSCPSCSQKVEITVADQWRGVSCDTCVGSYVDCPKCGRFLVKKELAAATKFSFKCAKCKAALKADCQLAGRKIRCPRCRDETPVPNAPPQSSNIVACPDCSARTQVDESLAGYRVRCRWCRRPLPVPVIERAEEESVEPSVSIWKQLFGWLRNADEPEPTLPTGVEGDIYALLRELPIEKEGRSVVFDAATLAKLICQERSDAKQVPYTPIGQPRTTADRFVDITTWERNIDTVSNILFKVQVKYKYMETREPNYAWDMIVVYRVGPDKFSAYVEVDESVSFGAVNWNRPLVGMTKRDRGK